MAHGLRAVSLLLPLSFYEYVFIILALHTAGDALSYALGSPHAHSEAVSMSRTVSSTSEVSISSTSSYTSETSATSISTLKREDSISAFQNKSNGHAHLEATSINSNQLTQEELVEEL